jgi:hypothetical protein
MAPQEAVQDIHELAQGDPHDVQGKAGLSERSDAVRKGKRAAGSMEDQSG